MNVLPTHVGVIPLSAYSKVSDVGTTHTRGGDPKKGKADTLRVGYYPHTWG